MTAQQAKGYAFAALAAAAYGTNPAFAIPLYADGMNANSVLLFRYIIGIPLLAALMCYRGIGFGLQLPTMAKTAVLGILMALSSLTLFESYNFMNSGVASTLLFVYPIMVALIMILAFKEKCRMSIFVCLAIMSAGLLLLAAPSGGNSFSIIGFMLVMGSALTYAIYIVFVNVSESIRTTPTSKLLFYVLCWGATVFLAMIPCGNNLTLPEHPANWLNLVALAIIPTVLSLACTTRAIQLIGSTPTAILGALEPVTAVVLSVVLLNQNLTADEIIGGILILTATTIVVSNNALDRILLHIRKMFPRH